jgi:hypothetical protein
VLKSKAGMAQSFPEPRTRKHLWLKYHIWIPTVDC